jgi:hypothetical protein
VFLRVLELLDNLAPRLSGVGVDVDLVGLGSIGSCLEIRDRDVDTVEEMVSGSVAIRAVVNVACPVMQALRDVTEEARSQVRFFQTSFVVLSNVRKRGE